MGNKLGEIPVPAIEAEKIVDTSSAGDAFVGGFLAQYVKNEPIEKAIKCGIWASGLIIQRFGISKFYHWLILFS
jgi:sugar/nucleoside kinase (ribokinase family)